MSSHPRAKAAARLAVKRAGGRPLVVARRRRQHPELSVVMPVYNVEEFLPAALDSVLGQTFGNLELIAVDDGSTDGSLDILRARARRDHRLVVLQQPNAGQGAARNTGVARARGEFLTFVDSDDVVPHRAYDHMVDSLRRSGSDFNVGSVVRLRHRELLDTAWVRTVHSRDRLGVTLEQFPNAMQDIICCNRMFRTDFWRQQVGGFESHIAYEDHVPMLTAYVRARKFDILAEVTYHWRVRLTSTGHKKADVGNLLDRIQVKEQAHELLRREASDFVYDLWVGRTLEVDFPPFLSIAKTSDSAYRNLVSATYRTFLDRATEQALGFVRVANKIRGQLAADGRWSDLAEAEEWLSTDPQLLPPTRISDGRVLATAPEGAPYLEGLSPRTLETAALETHFQGVLQGVEWTDDRVLIGGWSLLRGVSTSADVRHRAWLVDGDEQIDVEVTTAPNTRANVWGRQMFADYSAGGFVVSVPFSDLPARSATWQVMVEMSQEGLTVSGALEFRMLESGAVVPTGETVDLGGRPSGLSVAWTRSGGCQIQVDADPVIIESASTRGRTVSGILSRPAAGLRLHSRGDEQPVRMTAQADGRARFEATPPRNGIWDLVAEHGQPMWPGGSPTGGDLTLRPSRAGGLQVLVGLPHVEITDVRVDADTLSLTADIEHEGLSREELSGIRLSNPRTSLLPTQVESDDATATLSWVLTEAPFGLPEHLIPSQILRVRRADGEDPVHVRPSKSLGGRAPVWHETPAFDLKVGQVREGPLTLALQPPVGMRQRGAAAHRRMREDYWASTAELTDSVFFQCYRGEFATDSQLALDRAIAERFPEIERVWGVQDLGTRLPEGSRPVVMNSSEWYEAIARARFLSNNIDFGSWFRLREGQSYLQTFHGYPFKSMGIGFWSSKATSTDMIERSVARVNAEWDTILVPSEECAAYYRQEYRFDGDILVAGYPRTDALVNSDAALVRRDVLARLGVDPGKVVTLYAPTYRDKLTTRVFAAERFDDLDLDRLVRRLGEDHVVLVRGHNNNQRHTDRVRGVAQVVDVTDYPDINELTLAADVAVLDYSSLRFDWALTGKPMIFFVPDMEEYFDLRPPLFGFEESAPGPLLRTTDEVVAHLKDLAGVERAHRDEIAAFNARFNALHDGRASDRVLDTFFPDR